ncbi:MAG: aminoglycoside phosphotransferase family protein [Deltaproteobacteria bacterium]|nr:aminoglycoside phosphotransferase family protein [Deltaproteobacteria bacterium]
MRRGEQADVSLDQTTSGERCVRKAHFAAAGYLRERDALQTVGRLAPGLAPALLRHDDATRTLWLAFVEGVAPTALARAERSRAFEAVGAQLRRLAALPVPADPVPLEQAMAMRAHAWLQRTPARVAAGEVDALLGEAAAFAGAQRRWCHRDVRDENLRVRPDGSVVLLDWGQSRPDAEESDLVRLARSAADAEPGAEADLAALCRGLGYDRAAPLQQRRLAFAVALERLARQVTAA